MLEARLRDACSKTAVGGVAIKVPAEFDSDMSNRHPTRFPPGDVQPVGLHEEDLVVAVPFAREEVFRSIGFEPVGAFPCILGDSFDMARLPFAAVELGGVRHEPGVGVEILIGAADQVPQVEDVD